MFLKNISIHIYFFIVQLTICCTKFLNSSQIAYYVGNYVDNYVAYYVVVLP